MDPGSAPTFGEAPLDEQHAAGMRLAVVILAAGASSRMGEPKLLLPWAGTTILGHLIAQWGRLGASTIGVVHAPDHSQLITEIQRLAIPMAIPNPDPSRGMFSSIQCAALWPHWPVATTHWALVLGDQPHLPTALLEQLLAFAWANPTRICQPSHRHKPRHPVILPAASFQHLASSTVPHLKAFLAGEDPGPMLLEFEEPGLDVDLDYPADYARAKTRWGET